MRASRILQPRRLARSGSKVAAQNHRSKNVTIRSYSGQDAAALTGARTLAHRRAEFRICTTVTFVRGTLSAGLQRFSGSVLSSPRTASASWASRRASHSSTRSNFIAPFVEQRFRPEQVLLWRIRARKRLPRSRIGVRRREAHARRVGDFHYTTLRRRSRAGLSTATT